VRSEKELKREIRANRKLRKLGTGSPKCARCDEARVTSLNRRSKRVVLCYECAQEIGGRARIEEHHLADRHNDKFVVPIPGNDHRELSDLQIEWPDTTFKNPSKSPLLREAAFLHGCRDLLTIIQYRLDHAISVLEELDKENSEKDGPDWWKKKPSTLPNELDPDAWKKP
jgi:hypothetical protein